MEKTINSITLKIGTQPGSYPPGNILVNELFKYCTISHAMIDNAVFASILQNPGDNYIQANYPGGFNDGNVLILVFESPVTLIF